ncbi:MAG: DUF1028 domain-containing protein [Gaiellales bacterium]
MTFSIAAVDRETGDIGAAATTRFLAVGAGVLWAEVGIGAVCTQAMARIDYGPELLGLVRAGETPEAAIATATAADAGREDRQLGMIDGAGEGAVFTGRACFDWAGGRVLDGAVIQGNILVGALVLDAMEQAWIASQGAPLAQRLLRVLRAGDGVGGDRRGRQSAAVLVRHAAGGDPVDLRVDDHPAPPDELARLYGVYELVYGTTPTEHWVAIDVAAAAGIRGALRTRGMEIAAEGGWDGALEAALRSWAFDENLTGRWDGGDRIDPVVLEHLLG